MIGFFPSPYPEELLYSVCARYKDRARYRNRKSAVKDLFGKVSVSAIVDFPNHLDQLISSLPPGHNFSAEKIITENTLFSLFEPFLPVPRAILCKNLMKSTEENQLQARIGLKVKQIQPLTYLRYCPDCVVEDRKNYGETYWHRLPQLAGIKVCPEHKCFFCDTSIKLGRETSSYFMSANDSIETSTSEYINLKLREHQILLKMAQDASWLLSQNSLMPGVDVIRNRYYNALLKKGFAYYNGRLKNSKFINAFEDYFSSDLLDYIGRISINGDWIVQLLASRNTKITFHPIRHLLLMTFLEMNAEDFFLNFEEFKPFGNGPYPCLNAASDHFGKFLINDCRVIDNATKGKKRGLPLGVFNCECGFIYQRVGPDKSEEDKFRFDSVREYGMIWENKLTEYWRDSEISITKIADKLKTSSCKIIRHAIRLRLPELFAEDRTIQTYERYQNPRKTFSEMLSNYRKEWQSVVKNNPKATRQKLMDLAKFNYQWLRKNDSDWLERNLPPVFKNQKKEEYLDWKKIDNNLSKRVIKAISEIQNEKNPLARVSITEISRRVGDKKWLDKRKEKLPLTTSIIDENLESLEDFMLRKIEHTKNTYLQEKKIPTRLQFCVRAAIRNRTSASSKRIEKSVNEAIEFLKNTLR